MMVSRSAVFKPGTLFFLALVIALLANCDDFDDNATEANAGPDIEIFVGDSVTIDASSSKNARFYQWQILEYPAASAINLDLPDDPSINLKPDLPGQYTILLKVDVQGVPGDTVHVRANLKAKMGEVIRWWPWPVVNDYFWEIVKRPENSIAEIDSYYDNDHIRKLGFRPDKEGVYEFSIKGIYTDAGDFSVVVESHCSPMPHGDVIFRNDFDDLKELFIAKSGSGMASVESGVLVLNSGIRGSCSAVIDLYKLDLLSYEVIAIEMAFKSFNITLPDSSYWQPPFPTFDFTLGVGPLVSTPFPKWFASAQFHSSDNNVVNFYFNLKKGQKWVCQDNTDRTDEIEYDNYYQGKYIEFKITNHQSNNITTTARAEIEYVEVRGIK